MDATGLCRRINSEKCACWQHSQIGTVAHRYILTSETNAIVEGGDAGCWETRAE